jgi:DNA-binding GntR family transcriptional regulator
MLTFCVAACIQAYMQRISSPADPTQTRYEQAYGTIREMIVSGRLRGGDMISEVKLAEELEISRTPVREAVKRLVANGLVESTPRGLRVFRPKPQDVAEVYFLRAAIEGAMIRAACGRISPGEIAALRKIHTRTLEANGRDDIDSLVALNGEFHSVIAAVAGSVRAENSLMALDPLVATYRRLSLFAPGHRNASIDEHGRLIDLLNARDGDRAESLMRAHIARAGRRITDAVLQIDQARDDGETARQLANLDGLDTEAVR